LTGNLPIEKIAHYQARIRFWDAIWSIVENRSGLAEIMASFALPSKRRPCPDWLDSSGITAGQEIVSSKKGVFVGGFASHE
jgi:hypothetical protein